MPNNNNGNGTVIYNAVVELTDMCSTVQDIWITSSTVHLKVHLYQGYGH